MGCIFLHKQSDPLVFHNIGGQGSVSSGDRDEGGVYLMPKKVKKRNNNSVLLSNSGLRMTTLTAQISREMEGFDLLTIRPNTAASTTEDFY